jgi:fructose 1,6-bisphosphatase
MLIDTYLGYTGDDIAILMTHTRGVDDQQVHALACGGCPRAACRTQDRAMP